MLFRILFCDEVTLRLDKNNLLRKSLYKGNDKIKI